MSDPDNSAGKGPSRAVPALVRRVVFRARYPGLKRQPLQDFAQTLCAQVLDGREFTCLITDDTEMAALNGQYRQKQSATDVLSFPAAIEEIPGDGESGAYAGDVAISIQHARAQARALGHTLEEELCVLMLHGALHLAGMDHETDKGEMRRAESRWRKRLGLPEGLIARTRC